MPPPGFHVVKRLVYPLSVGGQVGSWSWRVQCNTPPPSQAVFLGLCRHPNRKAEVELGDKRVMRSRRWSWLTGGRIGSQAKCLCPCCCLFGSPDQRPHGLYATGALFSVVMSSPLRCLGARAVRRPTQLSQTLMPSPHALLRCSSIWSAISVGGRTPPAACGRLRLLMPTLLRRLLQFSGMPGMPGNPEEAESV